MKPQLPDFEVIEVVLKKEMPFSTYMKSIKKYQAAGWKVKAFQLGKHSDGLSKPITKNTEK